MESIDIQESLQKYLNENSLDFEVYLFDRNKQKKRKETLRLELPFHDYSDDIKKSNAWIVWLTDENQDIVDLQVYDFQLESGPYRKEKIVAYVDYKMQGIPYRDCGCVNSDWNEWKLADIYFKFGIMYRCLTRKDQVKFLKRLAHIEEFRDDIKRHLSFIGE